MFYIVYVANLYIRVTPSEVRGGADMKMCLGLAACLLLLVACGTDSTARPASREIVIKGSDTLLQMVANLAEAFSEREDHHISVTGGGSGTGIAALLNGEADIADSSRAMKAEEWELARSEGMEPVEVLLGRDMLSVVVHRSNPVSSLSLEEVSSIYKGETTSWTAGPITLYGRQSTSGTYIFFQEEVVKGEYSPKMRNMEGTQAILDAVRQDSSGIGYVGVGYLTPNNLQGIKVLGIVHDGETYSPLNSAHVAEYPISRPLFQYLGRKPEQGSPLRQFVLFELSEEGQRVVKESGYFPLLSEELQESMKALS